MCNILYSDKVLTQTFHHVIFIIDNRLSINLKYNLWILEKINRNIKRKISANYVVDFLMGEFISKKVKPGDRVIEAQIANEMNISQTVVR